MHHLVVFPTRWIPVSHSVTYLQRSCFLYKNFSQECRLKVMLLLTSLTLNLKTVNEVYFRVGHVAD